MRVGMVVALVVGCGGVCWTLRAADKGVAGQPAAAKGGAVAEAGVKAAVERGVRFLRENQHEQGGWGHVEVPEPRSPRFGGSAYKVSGDPFRRRWYSTPSLSDSAPAVLALLEAGQSASDGSAGAARVRAGLAFVHDGLTVGEQRPMRRPLPTEQMQIVPGGVAQAPSTPPPPVEGTLPVVAGPDGMLVAVMSTASEELLNDDAACAVAVEAMLCARRGTTDVAVRGGLEEAIVAGVNRLRRDHRGDGTWPGGRGAAALAELANLVAARQKRAGQANVAEVQPGVPAHPVLGDALILRSLAMAAREGMNVDREVLATARGRMGELYDEAGGRLGDGGAQGFYQAVAVLNMLYQADVDARRPAGAGLMGNAINAPVDAGVAAVARGALEKARGVFLKQVREAEARKDKKSGGGIGAAEAGVPVTSADLVAYFLLLESLRDSADPEARGVRERIVREVVRRQLAGGAWVTSSGGHFGTAWGVRVLVVGR